MIEVLLYILSIVTANVVTSVFEPISILGFIIPIGTFLIGFTFIFRDFIQLKYGRCAAYKCIFISMITSALMSFLIGDMIYITIASIIAFLVSETIDTEIYSFVKTSFEKRILFSGIVGGLFDSILFVIIGLSPFTTGIITWDMLLNCIMGQYIVKCLMQVFAYTSITFYKKYIQ